MRQELTQPKKQGSTGKTLLTSPSQPMKLSANSEEIDELRNHIKALKESLQIQEQEKLETFIYWYNLFIYFERNIALSSLVVISVFLLSMQSHSVLRLVARSCRMLYFFFLHSRI